jgi:hypothetical protein
MTPDDFRRLTEAHRRAMDLFIGNPQWNEMVKATAANQRAIQLAARNLRNPDVARSIEALKNAVSTPQFRSAAESWARLSDPRLLAAVDTWTQVAEDFAERDRDDVEPRLEELDEETVRDPDVALEWAATELDEVPDGWEAVPLIASTLSPARRRELYLRVAALALAAYIFVSALVDESEGSEGTKLIVFWLALGWLYQSVATAIDDADDDLKSST